MVSGMTAELTGGYFWQGAGIGFTVGLLNHAAHAFVEGGPEDPPKKSNIVSASDLYSRIDDYDGFWGKLEYIWDGGVKDGVKYDINGSPIGFAPVIGIPPDIGGPAKGAKWAIRMLRKNPSATLSITQIGNKFWKYAVTVPGKNGRTVFQRFYNAQGKSLKFFHDTYNSTNKYLHRKFILGRERIQIMWNSGQRYWYSKWK